MYCIPDMRALAKRNELQGDPAMMQRIVELPATALDVHTLFKLNKQLLIETCLKDEKRADFYESSLGLEKYGVDEERRERVMKMIHVVCFDDIDEETSCVYAIYVDLYNKRINVYFRGSVTPQDFREDLKAVFAPIRNPVKGKTGDTHLPDELGVHLGFRNYLYYEAERDNVLDRSQHGEPIMKCNVILDQVEDLMIKYEGFRLYIGGHSLGGALATILALDAAADDAFTKDCPVTCVTAGSPKVGNFGFLLAFEELEREGKLRCIHVADDRDPITYVPPSTCSPLHAVICQQRRFRHVGLKLLLRKDGCVIAYPPKMRTYCGVLCCDQMQIAATALFVAATVVTTIVSLIHCAYVAIPVGICCACLCAVQQREHHTQLKYIRRLEQNELSLRKLDIDELNKDRWNRPTWRWPILLRHKGHDASTDEHSVTKDEH